MNSFNVHQTKPTDDHQKEKRRERREQHTYTHRQRKIRRNQNGTCDEYQWNISVDRVDTRFHDFTVHTVLDSLSSRFCCFRCVVSPVLPFTIRLYLSSWEKQNGFPFDFDVFSFPSNLLALQTVLFFSDTRLVSLKIDSLLCVCVYVYFVCRFSTQNVEINTEKKRAPRDRVLMIS